MSSHSYGVKGSWLDHAWVGTLLEGEGSGPGGLPAILQGGGRCEHIASLHPRPSVRGEEAHPTGCGLVFSEHRGSGGVNLEK